MESPPSNSSSSSSSPSSSSSVNNNTNNNINTGDLTWRSMNLPFGLRSPLSLVLEYSGIMSSNREDSAPVAGASPPQLRPRPQVQSGSGSGPGCSGTGEVAIRIIGAGEQENNGVGLGSAAASSSSSSPTVSPPIHMSELGTLGCDGTVSVNRSGVPPLDLNDPEIRRLMLNDPPLREVPISEVYGQRYDIQQAAKWMEQLLPFSLLLLVVFIRQHLQGETLPVQQMMAGSPNCWSKNPSSLIPPQYVLGSSSIPFNPLTEIPEPTQSWSQLLF